MQKENSLAEFIPYFFKSYVKPFPPHPHIIVQETMHNRVKKENDQKEMTK